MGKKRRVLEKIQTIQKDRLTNLATMLNKLKNKL
jgi:hypothetical protein